MAWAEKLPSGRWRGVYRDQAGRRRSVGTYTHKPAAERKAAAKEDESRGAGWRDPDRARVPWGQWCAQWWPTRSVEPGTLARDTSRRDKHLMPRWEHVELGAITRHDIREWAAQLQHTTRRGRDGAAPLSASTVQRIIHLLSASLAAAVDAEILPGNPAARLKLPKGEQGVERYLTGEEYDAIRSELPDREGLIADALVGTGMRWGEMAGLHWHRLDLARASVRVVETWDATESRIKAYPKGRRLRPVPLPGWLTPELEKLDRRKGTCGLTHAQGKCRAPLVFTDPEGGVLDEDRWRTVWDNACADAGVGHVRPHDLRHTYASWLLQDGVSLEKVGMLLGHVNYETTRRYAWLQKDAPHEEVVAALDARRRGATRGAR